MQWEEIQRIRLTLVIPELEDWASGGFQRATRGRQSKSNELPVWMLERIIMGTSHDRVQGPIGSLMHREAWQTPAYSAMAIVLSAKHGLVGEEEQRNFLTALESRLRPLGPCDDLDGRGPGKPTAVHRDEAGRLHNADDMALVFKDRSMYALHGVRISSGEWQLRDDAKRILDVQNVEVRRALIERMGVREFITLSGLQPTHTDRFGSFYRLNQEFDVHGYVHVVCPSTKQDYFLAVPGNCRSAHEAVAWTFSMVPEDYDPTKEA